MRNFIFLLLLLCGGFISCSEEGSVTEDPVAGTSIQIAFQCELAQDSELKWEQEDRMSVIVSGVSANSNLEFISISSGTTAIFGGDISTWEGEHYLYGIYPYIESGYVVDTVSGSVVVDCDKLVAYSGVSDTSIAGVMLSSCEGVEVISTSKYNVESMQFVDAMSQFSFELTNIPEGESISGLTLVGDEELFISSSEVSFADGSITDSTTISFARQLSFDVERKSYQSERYAFGLFAVDCSGKALTMTLVGALAEYTIVFTDGFNFEQGLDVSPSTALDLQGDFIVTPYEEEDL